MLKGRGLTGQKLGFEINNSGDNLYYYYCINKMKQMEISRKPFSKSALKVDNFDVLAQTSHFTSHFQLSPLARFFRHVQSKPHGLLAKRQVSDHANERNEPGSGLFPAFLRSWFNLLISQ